MIYRQLFLIIVALGFASCETEFIPEGTNTNPEFVIEAYLEKSSEGIPVYLILSKTIGFYSEFSSDRIQELFVKADSVIIQDGNSNILLSELCLNDLPEDLKKMAFERLGLNPDSVNIDLCVYTDLSNRLQLKDNATYNLMVFVDQKIITSTTSLPTVIPLDSIWFDNVPGKGLDSFAQMFCIIRDLPGESNFYRYFTAGPNENLIAGFTSVTDDYFFDGQEFKFSLQKAIPPGQGFTDTSGYFRVGDTVRLKWCNIDQDHFDFWNTLEVSRTRQGPFSSYVRIKGNINGGLGIFGGQNCKYYTLVVKK